MTLLDGDAISKQSKQQLVILHEFLAQKIKTALRILIRLDICRRILRKFSENTRHALSIEWLYMNCQHNEPTRRVPDN